MTDLSGPVSDCERIAEGLLLQPVNAYSSLALIAAGLWVLGIARRRGPVGPTSGALAAGLIATGAGSFAFHGPGGTFAGWLHDASLLWLLLIVPAVEISRRARTLRWGWIAIALAVAGVIALIPRAAVPTGLLAVAVAVAVAVVPRSEPDASRRAGGRLGLPFGLVGIGAVIFLLSRTGGPWCDPDSLLQGHAAWHVLAAIALCIYATRSEVAQNASHRLPGSSTG